MPSSSRTVVGVFDDYASAKRAVEALVSNGFSRETIDVTSTDTLTSDSPMANAALTGQPPRASGGGIGGFFQRLFGTDDEYAGHYEEAVRRGAAIVSVATDDEDRAAEILDRNGAVDIDERAASWRQQGYTGGQKAVQERGGVADRSIPVVREELQVGKREVKRGGVRIVNRVQ